MLNVENLRTFQSLNWILLVLIKKKECSQDNDNSAENTNNTDNYDNNENNDSVDNTAVTNSVRYSV